MSSDKLFNTAPSTDSRATNGEHRARVGLVLIGAAGRMGGRISSLALSEGAFDLIACVTRQGALIGGGDHRRAVNLDSLVEQLRREGRPVVIIDFSSDEGCALACSLATDARCALLVGTTALSDPTLGALKAASAVVPVLVCSNTSIGVAAVAKAAAVITAALGPGYQASIVEQHHIHKKDAPSGTAKRIAQSVREAGGNLPDNALLSIRAGDIVGEHTLRISGPGETIELTHRATTRDLFARGALRLASWLATKPAGWWRVEDSLG